MIDGLALAATVTALAVTGWAGLAWARHRPPTRPMFVALGVVAVIVAAQVVIVVVRLAAGAGPAGAERVATLIGYLIMTVLAPPSSGVLARMEPTRWGSALIASGCLLVPVLMLRLTQVWDG